jgi:hypothetical protein
MKMRSLSTRGDFGIAANRVNGDFSAQAVTDGRRDEIGL